MHSTGIFNAPGNGQSDSAVIDAALRAHFKLSFADLETAYLAYLRNQPFTEHQRTDLLVTRGILRYGP